MPKLIDLGNIVEKYLQLAYPNRWIVIAYEYVGKDKAKLDKYHTVCRELGALYTAAMQGLIDLGCMAFLCDSEEEALYVYSQFPDPEVIGYACLFGPHKSEPKGMILNENT